MAHRRSRGPFKDKIQETRWSGALQNFSAQAAGTSALLMITAGSFTTTLLRLRGEINCYVDGASAPGKLCEIGIGALVVQEGSGTTVIQAPLTDPEAPWLFYERFVLGYEEMVTDVIDVPGLSIFRKTIDTKSMRILRPGREVQLVIENVTIQAATSVNLQISSRGLFGTH